MESFIPTLTLESTEHYLNDKIQKKIATIIDAFKELVVQVAELSYLNREYLLFFRGQEEDNINRSENSAFYPTIYQRTFLMFFKQN